VKSLTGLIRTLMIVALSAPLRAQVAPADLTSAKALYASASYEEALTELGKIGVADWDEHVDEYRALCLLALGRTSEAEQALEHLVRLRPLHSLANDQMSPRVVSLFETVRWRTLPSVARELYTEAKSAYDAGSLDEAIAHFRQLAGLLSEANLVEQTPNLGDLKELGDGFLKLAEARVAAASTPSPPTPPTPPTPVVVETTRIFTTDDRDVTAPVAIERRLPNWNPTSAARIPGAVRGTLEVVTDKRGVVESAKLIKSLSAVYDRDLLAAAKEWKFKPAMKDGQPVGYKWVMEIVLRSR
jgi:TonB family protein